MNKMATLTSLAMLRVDVRENRDYLSYLIPFVKYVLLKACFVPQFEWTLLCFY